MESVFKADYGWTLGICARDLDGIFNCFGPCVENDRFLRGRAGSECVQLLRQSDVALIGRYHKAGVEETINLFVQCFGYTLVSVPHVQAADTPG